jgi:hypothetical protein
MPKKRRPSASDWILAQKGVRLRKQYHDFVGRWPSQDFGPEPTGDPFVDELEYQEALKIAVDAKKIAVRAKELGLAIKITKRLISQGGRPAGSRNKSKRPPAPNLSPAAIRQRKHRSKKPQA